MSVKQKPRTDLAREIAKQHFEQIVHDCIESTPKLEDALELVNEVFIELSRVKKL